MFVSVVDVPGWVGLAQWLPAQVVDPSIAFPRAPDGKADLFRSIVGYLQIDDGKGNCPGVRMETVKVLQASSQWSQPSRIVLRSSSAFSLTSPAPVHSLALGPCHRLPYCKSRPPVVPS